MANKPLKIFLFVLGGVIAVTGAAYVAGRWKPGNARPEQTTADAPAASTVANTTAKEGRTVDATPGAPKGDRTTAGEQPAAVASQPEASATSQLTAPATPSVPAGTPSFDVVRVEGDGSAVVAGQAAPSARVELRLGGKVLGTAQSGPAGDFAIVLDEPLPPGNHQIELQATGSDGKPVVSPQTATVSVPDQPNGQVLAMVDQPGEASRILTAPEPDATTGEQAASNKLEAAAQPQPSAQSDASTASAPSDNAPAAGSAKVASTETQSRVSTPGTVENGKVPVAVKAVEIEGRKVFVAGSATPGASVRVYASDTLLGDAKASPDGQFLVEAQRDLPVGNYVVRADILGADGKVTARAAVPFQRDPGETLAAVAPSDAPAAPQASESGSRAAPSTAAGGSQESSEGSVADTAASEGSGTGPAASRTASPAQSAVTGAAPNGTQAASALPSEADSAVASAHSAARTDETLSPALQTVDGAVIIRRGDNLWRISRRVYGLGTRYSTIYLANQQQITNPNRIWPGQVFTVPSKSSEGEAADMNAMGEQSVTNPSAAN
ncbi:MAG: LysM peptidoglycan-binding domain-containing protein [Methylobacterium mesophilicum]|nr:LysM peptidoglycan-binding domain-containing protein [Methylobacterium mesophilicum]